MTGIVAVNGAERTVDVADVRFVQVRGFHG
jgi:hypothetical protein